MNEHINVLSVARGGGNKSLNIGLVKQETNYYCDPASAKMVLDYLGHVQSQSTLASRIGTDNNGSVVYRVTNCLNYYLGSGSYRYVLTSEIDFSNGLMYSIDQGKPVICHVDTKYLPHYNGYSCNHYVTAYGYAWAQGGVGSGGYETVFFNDPNNNSAYHGSQTCTYAEMTEAINRRAGYYIMGA